jgi:hypothetical protein
MLMVLVMTAAAFADPSDAGNQNQGAPTHLPVAQSSIYLLSK